MKKITSSLNLLIALGMLDAAGCAQLLGLDDPQGNRKTHVCQDTLECQSAFSDPSLSCAKPVNPSIYNLKPGEGRCFSGEDCAQGALNENPWDPRTVCPANMGCYLYGDVDKKESYCATAPTERGGNCVANCPKGTACMDDKTCANKCVSSICQ